jgi:hypothetical protein
MHQQTETSTPFRRFYHLFCADELDSLVREAAGELRLDVVLERSAWERGNWFVVGRVLSRPSDVEPPP